jgi:hypothetical protein
MPGPHNANIRGNAPYMRVWRWLTDLTAYAVFFVSISGLFLWTVLRAERRIGVVLLAAGMVTLAGLAYALSY